LIVSGYLGEEHGHDEGLHIVARIENPVMLDTLVAKLREPIGTSTDDT
jgi:hypothetical protein